MLEKQLQEVKELRQQLEKSPIKLEAKQSGLRIVHAPTLDEQKQISIDKARAKRAYYAKKNAEPLSQKMNLQGYKVA